MSTGRDATKTGGAGGGGGSSNVVGKMIWTCPNQIGHVQKLHEGQDISDVGDSTHAIKSSLRWLPALFFKELYGYWGFLQEPPCRNARWQKSLNPYQTNNKLFIRGYAICIEGEYSESEPKTSFSILCCLFFGLVTLAYSNTVFLWCCPRQATFW